MCAKEINGWQLIWQLQIRQWSITKMPLLGMRHKRILQSVLNLTPADSITSKGITSIPFFLLQICLINYRSLKHFLPSKYVPLSSCSLVENGWEAAYWNFCRTQSYIWSTKSQIFLNKQHTELSTKLAVLINLLVQMTQYPEDQDWA